MSPLLKRLCGPELGADWQCSRTPCLGSARPPQLPKAFLAESVTLARRVMGKPHVHLW